jgi:glycerol-3-phosphate acyltransferase PlsY
VGIATGVSDAAKTLVPIVICRALDLPVSSWALVGAAGTLGHCYPVWTKFRGGLGLASAIGMALAIIPVPMTIAIAAGIVVLFVIKNVGWSSLAGLSIAISVALAFDEPASRIAVAPIGAVISFLKTNLLTRSAEKRKKTDSAARLPSR